MRFLALCALWFIAITFLAGTATAQDRYVDDDDVTCGGNAPCYSTIADALAAVAVDGETIAIRPGTYAENLVVNQAVNLVGAGAGVTTLTSGNAASEFLILLGANVPITLSQGMVIEGLTFDGGGLGLSGDNDMIMFRARSANALDPIIIRNNVFDGAANNSIKGIESRSGGNITNVVIENCTFKNGIKYPMFLNSAINWLIQDSSFLDANTSALQINTSDVNQTHDIAILRCVFNNSTTRPDAGSFIPGSSAQYLAAIGLGSTCYNVQIEGNDITNSNGHSLAIGNRTNVALTGIAIRCNNITNSTYGALHDLPANVVDAELNWWGHASGPTNAGNPGGTGDEVDDGYDFGPWLAAASTGPGCSPTAVEPTTWGRLKSTHR